MDEVKHERCLRCKRRLKNPKYQAIGYGPVCARRMAQQIRGMRKDETDSGRDGGEHKETQGEAKEG